MENPSRSLKRWSMVIVVIFILIGCAPATPDPWSDPAPSGDLAEWPVFYVATDGSDANDCFTRDTACRSTGEVMRRVRDRYWMDIHYAEGTYDLPEETDHAGYIERNIGMFGEGKTLTVLEGPAIRVDGTVHVGMENLTTTSEFTVFPSATLYMNNTIVKDSERNGVANNGNLGVVDSEIINNQWVGILNSGTARIESSVISGNGRGGISNTGELHAEDTSIYDNHNSSAGSESIFGSGLDNRNPGNAAIERSTIYENTGKITIRNSGILSFINSTVSGNQVDPEWAAIWSIQDLTLSYTTVASNYGVGIGASRGTVIFNNSLVSGNDGGECVFPYGDATIVIQGQNFDSDGSCFLPGEVLSVRWFPIESPLADNGGPTLTHALEFGSPAIDAATGDCPTTDQRGNARYVGGGCDVGSYEFYYAEESIDPITELAQVLAIKNANCRYGPGTAYDIRDTLFEGQTAPIIGRNEENTWWQVKLPKSGKDCWVSYVTVEVSGPTDGVPIGKASQAPQAPPVEQPVAPQPQGCYTYDQYQNVVCTVPCPANPQPGGACTP